MDPAVTVAPALPSRRINAALRLLQAGTIAVVLVASTYKAFELDRYFVPKELVLHATALACGLLIARVFRESRRDPVDTFLVAYLAVSALSAVFATNHWLAIRSLCISASGILIFWTARALRDAGLARPLLSAIAVAVILGVMTSLLQTYGIETDLFSINRVPGGTLGNRNFIAHMAAFGLPIVVLGALQARHTTSYMLRALGVVTVLAVLILTRSRAGWLAFAVVVAIFCVGMLASRPLRTNTRTWLRLAGLVALGAVGVAAAVYTPNKLRWNAANPYLSSMKGVTNYQEGSGAGRLIQYRRSVKMAAAHFLLGAGPGNWSVDYPRYTTRGDPSLSRTDVGTTSNPWPSSDIVAILAERGFLALLLIGLAYVSLVGRGARRLLRSAELTEALRSIALLATAAAMLVTGAFDAVMLLPVPALLVPATLGALVPWPSRESALRARRHTLLVVTFVAAIGALRSTAQVVSMGLYSTTSDPKSLHTASLVDPGNYRLHIRLARAGSGLKQAVRCKHAKAAASLFPSATAPKALVRNCGLSTAKIERENRERKSREKFDREIR